MVKSVYASLPESPMPVDLMLDSGAFSAFKRKIEIDLDEYIDYALQYKDDLAAVINLDVIPGEFGRQRTPDEVEFSASQGWKNLMRMRKRGIEAVPVYHFGERRYWLDKMIGEGFTYIGISPAKDKTTAQKREWLDEVFTYLCGKNGFPEIKTHGFGMTVLSLLFRYPWYSCDSVTWAKVGAYGGILVPPMNEETGEYDFETSPLVVPVTRYKTVSKSAINGHLSSFGKVKRKYVLQYLEEQGFKLEDLQEYYWRQRVNCRYFRLVQKYHRIVPFECARQGNLFSVIEKPREGRPDPVDPKTRIVLATTPVYHHSLILNHEKIKNRLISYAFLMEGTTSDLGLYCKTGIIGRTAKKHGKRPVTRKLKKSGSRADS